MKINSTPSLQAVEESASALAGGKQTWAMLSTFWFKSEVRTKILQVMLETFGPSASTHRPLFIVDGCPDETALFNRPLAERFSHVSYIREATENGIPRLLHVLEKIPHDYILIVCDDHALAGDPSVIQDDVRSMIAWMETYPQIDAFHFYAAEFVDFRNRRLHLAQPVLKTQLHLKEGQARVSVCPRFFYNLGLHRRDRLISVLRFLESKGVKTLHQGESQTELTRFASRAFQIPWVARLLWHLPRTADRLWPPPLYQIILLKPQRSAFYHLGEVAESWLSKRGIKSMKARELLLEELMQNDQFSLYLKNAAIEKGPELIHC